MSPRKIESGEVKNEDWGGLAVGVLAVAATSPVPSLLFANEFVEVLKETDEDDEQRTSESHKENPCEQGHPGMGKSNHKGIVNQGLRLGRQACLGPHSAW